MYLVLVQILKVVAGPEWICSSSIDFIRMQSRNWHGGRADLLLILLMRDGIIRFFILRLI